MMEVNEPIEVTEGSKPSTESLGSQDNEKSPKGKNALELDDVRKRFTSCGRCSLFLAAYRIANGDSAIETAVANSDGHWFALPWDQLLRKLIIKSYGCRLDSDVYFFESSCPECLGIFRYSEPEADEPAVLLFKI